jgi:hypothetical protein
MLYPLRISALRSFFARPSKRRIGFILVASFVYGFIQPATLDAQGINSNRHDSFVTLEIRYHLAAADEVLLVWGINGWEDVPEHLRPINTVVADVMYSPMEQDDNTFVARLLVPSGATVDYAFEIIRNFNGEPVDIWDTNNPPLRRDYHTTVLEDSIAHVQPNLTLENYMKLARGIYTSLYFLLVIFIIFGTSAIIKSVFFTPEATGIASKHDPNGGIGVSLDFSSKTVVTILITIGLLNFFFTGTTALHQYSLRLPDLWDGHSILKTLSVHFNLAYEKTVATWYSSMPILLVSLAAFLCFITDRKRFQSGREGFLACGWLFVALLFLGLSLDEIGSLHERVGEMDISPFRTWSIGWVSHLAIPIALGACFLVSFAVLHVSHCRWSLAFMVLGILFFLSVPFQEWIEMALWKAAGYQANWHTSYRPILQVAGEEGSELFGTLCFLTATLIYLHRSSMPHRAINKNASTVEISVKRRTMFIGLVVALWFLGLGMAAVKLAVQHMPLYDGGIPDDWFPSSLAALAAIICIQAGASLRNKKRRQGLFYLVFGSFSMLLSMYYGAHLRSWLYVLDGSNFSIRGLINGSLAIAAVTMGVILSLQVQEWWSRFTAVLWAGLLGLAFLGLLGPEKGVALDFLAFAFLLVSLLAHLHLVDDYPESNYKLSTN